MDVLKRPAIPVAIATGVVLLVGVLLTRPSAPVPAPVTAVVIGIEDLAWMPRRVSAMAGRVEVTVTNEGGTRHDFTIEHQPRLEVPPRATVSATYDLGAGQHTFYCTLHPGMSGTLLITGR